MSDQTTVPGLILWAIFGLMGAYAYQRKNRSAKLGFFLGLLGLLGFIIIVFTRSKPVQSSSTIETYITGTTFFDRQSLIRRMSPASPIWLTPDPNNPYDPNAIRVESEEGQVGFIHAELAAKISPLLLSSPNQTLPASIVRVSSPGTDHLGLLIRFNLPGQPSSSDDDPDHPPIWFMVLVALLALASGIIQFLVLSFGAVALIAGLNLTPYLLWFAFTLAGFFVAYLSIIVAQNTSTIAALLFVYAPGVLVLWLLAFTVLPAPYGPSRASVPPPSSSYTVPVPTANPNRPADTPRPTNPPTAPPSPTRESCLSWIKITTADVGARLCVTGQVYSTGTDQVAYYVKFSNDTTSFYLVSYAYHYPDIRPGSCVRVTGPIKRIGSAPVIVLDEISKGEFLNCTP